jgi:hypothetical protein
MQPPTERKRNRQTDRQIDKQTDRDPQNTNYGVHLGCNIDDDCLMSNIWREKKALDVLNLNFAQAADWHKIDTEWKSFDLYSLSVGLVKKDL